MTLEVSSRLHGLTGQSPAVVAQALGYDDETYEARATLPSVGANVTPQCMRTGHVSQQGRSHTRFAADHDSQMPSDPSHPLPCRLSAPTFRGPYLPTRNAPSLWMATVEREVRASVDGLTNRTRSLTQPEASSQRRGRSIVARRAHW